MKTTASKFSPTSPEQFAALKAGDEVTSKSGKVYRVMSYNTGLELRQVRNGKLYGADYPMKRENIAAPSASVVDVAAIRADLGLESRMYSDERVLQIAARVAADEARLAAR